jgi:hypothetical protein
MEVDGSNQKWLIRGSSANWSPALAMNSHGAMESRQIVFHASASGTRPNDLPIRPDPGAPTFDSDLFLLNVDDCLQYLDVQFKVNCRDLATDITKDLQPDPSLAPNYNDGQFSPPNPPAIHEDADWSPDGTKIVFTSHRSYPPCTSGDCNYPDTEIYTINTDGTGLTQLTHNTYEERAPAWSPDGSQIAFMCRIGRPRPGQVLATFEICVIDTRGDAYGTIQLTQNNVLDATPSWSPDGTQIVFHRNPAPFQLWMVKAKWICEMGSCTCQDKYPNGQCEVQLTTNTPDVMNGFPHWGVLRVRVPKK